MTDILSKWATYRKTCHTEYEADVLGDEMAKEIEKLRSHISNRISEPHENLLCEAMAEVKATVDGDSNQPVKDIIYGFLAELSELKDIALGK